MTTTRTREGKPLHFPGNAMLDSVNAHRAPPAEELAAIADAVMSKALPEFVAGLMKGARRRRYEPRWADVNRARLILARHCLDRMIAEGLDVGSDGSSADAE